MHIWYRLRLPPPASFERAVEKIKQLRAYARTVGFTGSERWPGVGELRMGTDADEYPAVRYVSEELGNGRERITIVPATHWVRFSTMPGNGIESAMMGLATYPDTNRYGRDHLLRCHLSLIKLLDYAKEIGVLDRVSDEGDYCESRSVDVPLTISH